MIMCDNVDSLALSICVSVYTVHNLISLRGSNTDELFESFDTPSVKSRDSDHLQSDTNQL